MITFKPTKWKLYRCLICKSLTIAKRNYCVMAGHQIQETENLPFFVPIMKITHVSRWSSLRNIDTAQDFPLSASKLDQIVRGCCIEAGGFINNQMWAFNKVGTRLTICWVGN